VYKAPTSLGITGVATLDAQFNPNAAWIFQIGTLFYAETYSEVKIINRNASMNGDHVWWAAGSSATLKTGATVLGTVMADQSISTGVGVTSGPLLAYIGAVTLLDSTISTIGDESECADNIYVPTASPTASSTASLRHRNRRLRGFVTSV
jgi:hypothetical protein